MKVFSLVRTNNQKDFLRKTLSKMSSSQMPRLGLLVFVITAIFTFFCSEYTITSIPEYVVGDIASSDIVVPVDIPVKDEEATNLRQKAAKEAVLPVYQYKESRSSGIIKEVSATFLALRNKLNSEELEKAGRSGLLDDNGII